MPDEDTIARREEASKIAKATYVLEKRILNLLDERILSPEENMENLSTLEGEIVHAIKASIKYGRDNTNHLSEVIAESSSPDYEDILAKLDELILVLKNNPIAPSTAQAPVEQVNYEEVPVEPIMTDAETVVEGPVIETGTETEDVPEFVDTLTTETTPEELGATEIEPEFASELEPEPVAGANAVPEPEPTPAPVDTDPNKPMSPDEIAALIAAAKAQSEPEIEATPEPAPTAPVDSDPNKPMSPEDIAALIAATEAQSEPEIEAAPEPALTAPIDSDPNKPMSPEDIAALIAATEAQSEPEIEIESTLEPVAQVDSDPNKPMSPDEIEALIAAAESGAAVEIEPTPEPATPAVDDPNKQMSPEDIAALFASSNLELEPEPSATKPKTAIEALSKHEPSPASDDPNKPTSPDDIAALIASLGQ